MRSDGNQEKGDRIHAETDGWQLPRVRSRILRSDRGKNSGNRQHREQNEPSAPDNSIRIVCLFDHHRWAISGTVLVDQESHTAAALLRAKRSKSAIWRSISSRAESEAERMPWMRSLNSSGLEERAKASSRVMSCLVYRSKSD